MMNNDLTKEKCLLCRGSDKPLKGDHLAHFVAKLPENWELIEEHHIEKKFTFKNFQEALKFVNRVGELAESEGHHPDILLSWGKVVIKLWTHKMKGLSQNDFILAAKCDALYS